LGRIGGEKRTMQLKPEGGKENWTRLKFTPPKGRPCEANKLSIPRSNSRNENLKTSSTMIRHLFWRSAQRGRRKRERERGERGENNQPRIEPSESIRERSHSSGDLIKSQLRKR